MQILFVYDYSSEINERIYSFLLKICYKPYRLAEQRTQWVFPQNLDQTCCKVLRALTVLCLNDRQINNTTTFFLKTFSL